MVFKELSKMSSDSGGRFEKPFCTSVCQMAVSYEKVSSIQFHHIVI